MGRTFASLRYLVTEAHKLTLLLESRWPMANLLPDEDDLSSVEMCETVELVSRDKKRAAEITHGLATR